jgi:Zn-dependent M16 (insulinase) family peptidase
MIVFRQSAGPTNFLLVREYHSNYYVPHNLALIVAGKLSSGTSSLLHVIQEQIEPNLIGHGLNRGSYPPGWKRPFVETASALRNPIPTTTKHIIEFPEKDECTCFVTLSQFLLRKKF